MNFRFSRSSLCLLAGITLFGFTGAWAAEPPADQSGSASAQGAIEVVVSASRGEAQDPINIPQSVTSIDQTTIEEEVYQGVESIIRNEPGIGLVPAEGNPNFWQQGFSIRGLGAQRVLTLTDGVRQAGQGVGYGGGNLSLYDTFNIERVEIVRGPASVLYGTDAFGGVINIITRNPVVREKAGANGGASYNWDGSRDLSRVSAYVDSGDENFGSVLGMTMTDSGEPNLPNDIDAEGGSFRELGAFGKADYYIDSKTRIRLLGNFDRNNDILVEDSIMVLPIASFPPPGSMIHVPSSLFFKFPRYQRSLVGLEMESKDLDSNWDFFKSGLYWQNLRRQFHRETAYYSLGSPGFAGPPLFVNPAATINTAVVNTDDDVDTVEWQSQGRRKIGENQNVVVGFDMGWDRSNLKEIHTDTVVAVAGVGPIAGGRSTTTDLIRGDAEQFRFGVYAQDTVTMSSFDMIPGVRLDHFSVDDNQSSFQDDQAGFSGSLGNVYHLDQDHSLFLNLATGFRAPDLGERFQNGVVNLGAPSRLIGKADLDSERAYSVEAGAKHRGDGYSLEYAAYASRIQDFIGRNNLGIVDGFFTEQYDNLGDVSLYGGEISGNYELNQNLNLYSNASRTWTSDDDKVDLASWAFNYGVEYYQPVESSLIRDFRAALNLRTVLKSTDHTVPAGQEKFEGPGFTVVDLVLNFGMGDFGFGRSMLIGGIKNLFDREYKEPFFNMYQPERSLFAGVKVEF